MPFLNVKISASPDEALSGRIASTLQALTVRHLKKRPVVTSIAMTSVAPEHWFVGGRSLAEQGKGSFWLDIKVTDGTNMKDEKSAYIASVFAAMAELLGPLHEESYVLVHDVRAEAYGYGGLTQEYRYVEAAIAAAQPSARARKLTPVAR